MMFILEKSVPMISCLVLARTNSVQLGLQLGSAHLRTTLFRQFCFCTYFAHKDASFGTGGCVNNLIITPYISFFSFIGIQEVPGTTSIK
jgi:hypothetical protein